MINFSKKYEIVKHIINGLHPEVRYIIVTGGRGSGKSYPISIFLLILMNNFSRWCMFARFTMASAIDTIIPEFKAKIDLLQLSKFYNVNRDRIADKASENLSTPARQMVFKGLKGGSKSQTSRLRGLNTFSVLALDEAQESVDQEAFFDAARSIRSEEHQNLIFLILNPATKRHWIYEHFFQRLSIPDGFCGIVENVCYIHTTYLDNIDNLPADIIFEYEQMKKHDIKKYNHIVLGAWIDAVEGVIFQRWTYLDSELEKTYKSLPYIYGMDFGFSPDPATLIKVAVDVKQRLIFVEEVIYKTRLEIDELSDQAKKATNGKLIIADSARNDSISYLLKQGCNIKAVVKGKVDDEINIMESWKIVVCGDSPNIVVELKEYHRKNGIIIDSFNHAIDAIRYAFKTLYDTKPKQPNNAVIHRRSVYGA